MKKIIKQLVPDALVKGYHNYQKQKRLDANAGDKVVCPICGARFKHFEPNGLMRRENARCPNCESLERHRLLWKFMHEKTNLFNPQTKLKLLHFAPEPFFYDAFCANKNIDYTPCDFSPEIFNYADAVPIQKVDITRIPFPENHFDVILCNHVLEHIPDDRLAMRELYRVMKPGGWGIFQVPLDYKRDTTYEDFSITDPKAREKAFGQDDHVRWYGKDYTARLQSVGFNVTEDDYVKSFSKEEQFRFGFMDSELIYFCRKV